MSTNETMGLVGLCGACTRCSNGEAVIQTRTAVLGEARVRPRKGGQGAAAADRQAVCYLTANRFKQPSRPLRASLDLRLLLQGGCLTPLSVSSTVGLGPPCM